VTVFGAIPAGLIRPSIEAEVMADWHPRARNEPSGGPGPEFGDWGSLTAALRA